MKHQWTQEGDRKGSVIVLTVFFIVFVFLPLMVATVDVGFLYSERSSLQSVADIAVLGSMGNVNFYDMDSGADIDSDTEKEDIKERVWKIFEVAGITEDKLVGADKDAKLQMTFKTETKDGISNVIGVDVKGTALIDTFFYSVIDPSKAKVEVAFQSKCYIKYKWQNSIEWVDYNNAGLVAVDDLTFSGNALAGSYDSLDTAYGTDPSNYNFLPDVNKKGIFQQKAIDDNLMVATGGDFDSHGNNVEVNGDLYSAGTINDSSGISGTAVDNWDSDDVPPAISFDDIPMPELPTSNHNTDYAMVNSNKGFNAGGSAMWDGSDVQAGNKDKLVLVRGGTYVLDGAKFAGSGNKGIGSIEILNNLPGDGPIPADEIDPDGWTTVYVKGDWHMSGQAWFGDKMRIVMVTEGSTFKDTGQADWYCDIIAPGTDIHITGQGSVFGRIMGRTVDVGGQGKFSYDEQIGSQSLPSATGMKPSLDIPPRLVQTIPDPE